jgi:hypothetical protein
MCMFRLIHFNLSLSLALLCNILAVRAGQLYRAASNKHSNSTLLATLLRDTHCSQQFSDKRVVATKYASFATDEEVLELVEKLHFSRNGSQIVHSSKCFANLRIRYQEPSELQHHDTKQKAPRNP